MYKEINYSPKISRNMMGEPIPGNMMGEPIPGNMGEPIPGNHGVTHGRNSSCNIFSFYISDMSDTLKSLNMIDFTGPENSLQLSDDTLIMAEYENSLILKFRKIIWLCEKEVYHS